MYRGSRVIVPLTLTSVLGGDEWSTSCLAALLPGKNPGTRWTGGWVGPTARLDNWE